MSGIYIHIPYCHSRCIYCDFYTQTSTKSLDNYVQALCMEIEQRKDFLGTNYIKTIYFGGGTPSLLHQNHIDLILNILNRYFEIDKNAEITFEANPDDIDIHYIKMLKSMSINRLSIGIQSFDNDELKFLNRRHTAEQAIRAVKTSQDNGFGNISIDLIYGLPNQSREIWNQNISEALLLNVPHISAYHLIYEQNTPIEKMLYNNKISEKTDLESFEMFNDLIERLKEKNYEQYEISNFAKNQKYAIHNTSYWKGEKYLGLGASSHSFDTNNRYVNINSIEKYIEGVNRKKLNIEVERLSIKDKLNELILTSLRTKWGLNLELVKEVYGTEKTNIILHNSKTFLENKNMHLSNNIISITKKGVFISDKIMSDLMFI